MRAGTVTPVFHVRKPRRKDVKYRAQCGPGATVHTLFQILFYFQLGYVSRSTWKKVRVRAEVREYGAQLPPASLSLAETPVRTPQSAFVTPLPRQLCSPE